MAAPPPPAAAAQAPPAAVAQKFSLGAAAFGGQPDDSCAHPDEQAPLAWQRLLVQLADPPARRGLFTSCRAGRNLVLAHTPQVTLTLPLLQEQPIEQWLAQYDQVKAALLTRGSLPTRLRMAGWGGCTASEVQASPLPLRLLSLLLQPTTAAGITDVAVWSVRQQHVQPSAVTHVLADLRSLTRLDLTCADVWPLPAPSALPQLRDISFDLNHLDALGPPAFERLCSNLAHYLPQLTSLQLEDHTDVIALIPFHLLFTPAAPAPHLTTLNIQNTNLTDQLLGLLLDHTPALGQLTVNSVDLQSAAHSGRVWGVEHLTVEESWPAGIVHLPVCRTGKLHWHSVGTNLIKLVCESDQVS